MPADPDRLLVDRIRRGEPQAWEEFIARYEGRLLAFAESRVGRRAAAEDIVQEAFLGFLVSLPNYDESTPLESWLFSITAHKLTDALRREGRRPTIPLYLSGTTSGYDEPPGDARAASSLARSQERRAAEQQVIANCLRSLIESWKAKGEFERLKCIELLFVPGLANKDVAARLGISEQAVANHKHFVVTKLKDAAAQARLRNFDVRDVGIDT
ncbi:MAG TPA: sigma-70 family RNA polymerase sigma factor [Planctomycetaceae bacterium]|nr:sigma-70 family RNA polymerase sigma factor [Planctomycetaceae bacterium]